MRTGGIAGVVEQLSIGLQRLGGDTERAAALARIFGKENLAAAGALINNLDKLKALQGAIQQGSQGAALAQAQTRMQSLSEILGQTASTAATLRCLLHLGEAVSPHRRCVCGRLSVEVEARSGQYRRGIAARAIAGDRVCTRSADNADCAAAIAAITAALGSAGLIGGVVDAIAQRCSRRSRRCDWQSLAMSASACRTSMRAIVDCSAHVGHCARHEWIGRVQVALVGARHTEDWSPLYHQPT
ncbi:MAG: hypothetical protein KatS3mg038_1195 [Candidatus Kapaibacterium sp.]|nr:MAG: hypothetical protein KatS3mg038_1195 [Candidatus Kapabacteria bacterium]